MNVHRTIPSVDSQLDKCAVLAGQPRLTCYENLDKYLMTKVVPWVPYLRLVRDAHHEPERDALRSTTSSPTTPAYANIAVK